MKNAMGIGEYIGTGIKVGIGAAVAFITMKYTKEILDKTIDAAILYGVKKFVQSEDSPKEEKKDESGE